MANESHSSQFGSGFDDSKDRRIVIISGIICLVAILVLQSWTKPDPLAGIPTIGRGGSLIRKIQYFWDAKGMYLEGFIYHIYFIANGPYKYGNGVFRIPGSGEDLATDLLITLPATDNIVLAPKFLEEVKRLPEDVLDATEANFEVCNEQPHLNGY
ncbi:unnamed protein product [Clonostachys chloroleuca]|uniref:Uncharacterized protein n=1 Tax=Clonostachys chloroleuca TaxID=1926264 RepID=A0AA35M3R8_9HYPO|nr:unnamed protein product [Clonostachys chloroleuca]